jgi:hypothetical protein
MWVLIALAAVIVILLVVVIVLFAQSNAKSRGCQMVCVRGGGGLGLKE